MPDINYVAVAVATVAAFILSGVWYGIFAGAMAKLQGKKPDASDPAAQMPPWKILVELARSFVIAFVLAALFMRLGTSDWVDAVTHGFWLWIAFPVVLWTGAIIHENVPLPLAAIHAGDWLVKLMAISFIVGIWR